MPVSEMLSFLLSNVGSILFLNALDKKIAPRGANDIELINGGRILENNKIVGQCRVPFGDLSKAVITMHVVVQPSVTKVKTDGLLLKQSKSNESVAVAVASSSHYSTEI
ncbi:hypothetical protein V6N12_047549 [Hibiscus sabdariffa]|uniref:UBL3-like ubiquitin domain-containing protein n=1 Tax=Hibiscus sabdariffa TaxID=183260 RepID=A0ABR2DBJ6_9ROSI